MLAFKLLLSLAVLAAGALGGAIPLRRRRAAGADRWLGFGNALAAGIFLGAGLVHMLPDAVESWNALQWSYPMAYLLAASGFVLMFLVEHALLSESDHEMVHAPSSEPFALLANPREGAISAYAVLAALSVHAFLAGLALGAEPELAGALVIFGAIMVHKSVAGFALGVSLVRGGIAPRTAWQLLALFALATPLGILIGSALDDVLEGTTRRQLEAVLLALAAGTFAYVATMVMLREEAAPSGGRLPRWLLASGGMALMALLAIWV